MADEYSEHGASEQSATTGSGRRRAAQPSQSVIQDADPAFEQESIGSDRTDEGDDFAYEDWTLGGIRRPPRYDRETDGRLSNLDEALHGTHDPVDLPVQLWDETFDQDKIALESLVLESPHGRPEKARKARS
jgi:hypothetical protein